MLCYGKRETISYLNLILQRWKSPMRDASYDNSILHSWRQQVEQRIALLPPFIIFDLRHAPQVPQRQAPHLTASPVLLS